MTDITISTPALVFPALSVLMLAYTNRFIAISKRVRALHAEHRANPDRKLMTQIKSLKRRLILIRNMQITAITGFLMNIICMALILLDIKETAVVLFGISLICIMISLGICILEIYFSAQAMSIQLSDDLNDR